MKEAKNWIAALGIVFVVLMLLMQSTGRVKADGVKYYSTTQKSDSFIVSCDSGNFVVSQIDSLTGTTESGAEDSSGAPLFYFANLGRADVAVVTGFFEAYIDTVDLDSVGTSTATVPAPDTTGNDTLILTIYTAFNAQFGSATTYSRAGEEALVACTLTSMTYSAAGATGSQGAKFTIPSTAGIGDVLYGRLTHKYEQPEPVTTDSLGDTSQIVYMTHVRMIAR